MIVEPKAGHRTVGRRLRADEGSEAQEVRWLPETTQHSKRTESCIHYFCSAVGNMSIERKGSPCPIIYVWWHCLKEMKVKNLLSYTIILHIQISGNLIWIYQ